MAHSNPRTLAFGTDRLSLDIETLINNRKGSDIQFKVGDGVDCVTIYAHSAILCCRSRYFAAMLDEEKHWKESSKGVIHKPNISPGTFRDVLYYIYTGKICTKNAESIIDLIVAADEMDLEELSTECQAELIRTVKHLFSDEDDSDVSMFDFDESTKRLPMDVALHTHIIPALNLANSHALSHLSQKLLKIMLPHMKVIIKSQNAYATFIEEISSESLTQIFTSDNLAMTEKIIWDLALDWGCHHTSLTKAAVEARLKNAGDEYEEEDDDDDLTGENLTSLVSTTQLKQLKEMLAPLLPFIRFSLFEPRDYADMIDILNFFLPRRRSSDLQRFFIAPDSTRLLDAPRKKFGLGIPSVIVVESKMQKLLQEYIFETGGIIDCSSKNHLKFELLFRASEHGFLAKTFHQHCDNKGPTLTLVRSSDGHLFGGVNFADWNYENRSVPISPGRNQHWTNPSNTPMNSSKTSANDLNFLFALADGRHRSDSAIFKYSSVYNALGQMGFKFTIPQDHAMPQGYAMPEGYAMPQGHPRVHGPSFGDSNRGFDLYIGDNANIQSSFSALPRLYKGIGASNTALAGAEYFTVSNYEVFSFQIAIH